MSIIDFCRTIQEMRLATALRESTLMFPILEGTHLLGLALMMAPVAMLDMRLLGILWKDEPATKIRNQFLPITFTGFAVMITTGLLLFWSEAVKCWSSKYFRFKIILLVLAGLNALVFHSTIDRRMAKWENDPRPPSGARFAGAMSLALWTLIIATGRYTAYNL